MLLDDDPQHSAEPVITNIPGFSEPLTFDDEGNLYYGTADFQAVSQSLHRFTREQLEAAVRDRQPLDFSAGEEVLSGIGGLNLMVWHNGQVYFTDLGFSSGSGSIQRVDMQANFRLSVFATLPGKDPLPSPSFLALRPGELDFAAGVGGASGSLAVAYSDFVSLSRVAEIVPQLFFVRGEVNSDGTIDISDAIALLEFLSLGGKTPNPKEAADVDTDGEVDLTDVVFLLDYLFREGAVIPPPFPEPGPGHARIECRVECRVECSVFR